MEYEGRICRAPMERSAFMLPVAVGCAYNACKFCMLFKHLQYREIPLIQIEEELQRVQAVGGNPARVYFGDGNAFGLSAERLLTILDMVHRYFPACTVVNMDATVTNIAQKTDEELAALAAAGVKCLYIGIESGLDDVLAFMAKGHTVAEAEAQIARLHAHGIGYAAHFMTGVAGRGRGIENAEALAAFFNRTQPEKAVNFSLFLSSVSPLGKEYREGHFAPASEQENFLEERRLLELITVPLQYDGFRDFIPFRVRGFLPADKEKMLAKLDAEIARHEGTAPLYAWSNENAVSLAYEAKPSQKEA